jgi:tRNA pseudouridine32 synthase/23S rRNA pseudouridine746 synthase
MACRLRFIDPISGKQQDIKVDGFETELVDTA